MKVCGTRGSNWFRTQPHCERVSQIDPIVEDALYTNHQTKPYARLKAAAVACLSVFVLVATTGCGAAENTDSPDSTSDTEQVQQAVGTCTATQSSDRHKGIGKCSGYPNSTGRFRVTAVCCPYCNTTSLGNCAYINGGTSTVNCGSTYATTLKITSVGCPNSG